MCCSMFSDCVITVWEHGRKFDELDSLRPQEYASKCGELGSPRPQE